jgi:hypothetical protein
VVCETGKKLGDGERPETADKQAHNAAVQDRQRGASPVPAPHSPHYAGVNSVPGASFGSSAAPLRGLCFLLLPLIFAACASAPKPEQFYAERADSFALMAPGADIYFTADVPAARPILDKISLGNMGGGEVSDFLDMTSSITAALYGGDSRRFLAAAKGKYPNVRGGIFFSSSRDWKKKKSVSEIEYWRSDKSNLSVYLNASSLFVSDADPFVPAPGAESPPALADIRAGSALAGWMNEPSGALNAIISALGVPLRIPAERLIFGVYKADVAAQAGAQNGKPAGDDAAYTAALRLETADKNQAAALAQIFSLAKLAAALLDFSSLEQEQGANLASMVKIFLTNNPSQDGNALILKTGVMKGGELALLFNTLSVYSK